MTEQELPKKFLNCSVKIKIKGVFYMNRRFRFESIYYEVFEFNAPSWRKAWHKILHITGYKRKEFVQAEEIK